jgi:hypothetical protein
MTQREAAAPAGYAQQEYHRQPHQQADQQGPQQPGPQQPGQAPQGQAPQRPAGWNDPYGQRSADAGVAAAPPAAEPSRQPEASQVAEAAPQDGQGQDRPAAVRYPDLPDGRPQYGVRVTPKHEPGQNGTQPQP